MNQQYFYTNHLRRKALTALLRKRKRTRNITLRELYNHCLNDERLHPYFDFRVINDDSTKAVEATAYVPAAIPDCGTAGCIAGELPLLDKRFYFHDGYLLFEDDADAYCLEYLLAEYFNISVAAAEHLFVPDMQQPAVYGGQYLSGTATLQEVLSNLLIFIERQERGEINDE